MNPLMLFDTTMHLGLIDTKIVVKNSGIWKLMFYLSSLYYQTQNYKEMVSM